MLTKKNIYDHRVIFIAVITVLNIFLDQITKILAKSGLTEGVTVRVVGDLFRMRLVTNEGAFLGMGRNLPHNLRFVFFVIIPTILIILLAVYVIRSRHLAIYEMACFLLYGRRG